MDSIYTASKEQSKTRSVSFVKEKLYLSRLVVEEVHIDFKYLKYLSYEDTNTLWADLAGTLHDSVDIAESLNE